MKHYYIASGLDNIDKVRELKAVLDAAGWQHTYDWTAHGAVDLNRLESVSAAEEQGVSEAEVVIVLLPGGCGTHTELGMALTSAVATDRYAEAQDPRICIFSPNPEADFRTKGKTCAFYHHPCVERFGDMQEMINSLLGAN